MKQFVFTHLIIFTLFFSLSLCCCFVCFVAVVVFFLPPFYTLSFLLVPPCTALSYVCVLHSDFKNKQQKRAAVTHSLIQQKYITPEYTYWKYLVICIHKVEAKPHALYLCV